MDRAKGLPKLSNFEKERELGYVYGVSGPGTFYL